ncbi:MAG: hypothetical protein K6T26_06350 [Alicyclobacillus sp.]|nr:hypothetical protein [Alicyclobacillus sp.]
MVGKFLGNAVVVVIGFLMVVLIKTPAWLKFLGMIVMLLPLLVAAIQHIRNSGEEAH